MPPAQLNDVMLLPEGSNWQARVHDKFEGFTQDFDDDRRIRTALRSSRGPLSEFAFARRPVAEDGHSVAQN